MIEDNVSPSLWPTEASYRLLQSSDEKSLEAKNELQVDGPHTYIGYVLLHPGTNIVLLLMIFITNLILVSMSIIPLGSTSHIPTHNSESTIHTSFSQDRALQSLDHAYDDMWGALSLNKTSAGLIYTSDNGANEGNGAIGM